MSKKPLYQPWNEEEFLADIDVRCMNDVQRWMYRTLLQAAFFTRERPYLPADDLRLQLLAGCSNKKLWDRNKTTVLKMFNSITIDGVEVLANKRVCADWQHLMEYRQQMSDLGTRSAQVRRTLHARSPAAAQEKLRKGKLSKQKGRDVGNEETV